MFCLCWQFSEGSLAVLLVFNCWGYGYNFPGFQRQWRGRYLRLLRNRLQVWISLCSGRTELRLFPLLKAFNVWLKLIYLHNSRFVAPFTFYFWDIALKVLEFFPTRRQCYDFIVCCLHMNMVILDVNYFLFIYLSIYQLHNRPQMLLAHLKLIWG